MVQVPLVDLVAQQAEIMDEVLPGVEEVLRTGAFIGGAAVADFETAYAAFSGVAHCIGVANGTDALELALRAADVAPGDEVILPANSFIATAEAVSRIGARPVLVDVDPEFLLIDPRAVEAAVTGRTRAVVPVHLFGQTAPMEEILDITSRADLLVVEDAAQSQGASRRGVPTGSRGLAAGTSFYPGKNLGAAGDAGAVLTDDDEIARRVRLLGAHGSERKYVHSEIGMNSRLDAVQAVVLSAKLRRLATWNEARRAAAQRYHDLLADLPEVRAPRSVDGNVDVWHLYVIRVADRNAVLAALHEAGVGAGIHYPTPIHLTEAYAGLGAVEGSFPVAEQAANEILSLPLFPHISESQQTQVVDALRRAVRSSTRGPQ